MAKKAKKTVLIFATILFLVAIVAKILFFDFIKITEAGNLTEYSTEKTLVIQKNKLPNYSDIVFIDDFKLANALITRCIAVPRDVVKIVDGNVFINDNAEVQDYQILKKYRVNCFNEQATNRLKNQYKLIDSVNILGTYFLNLSKSLADSLENDDMITIKQIIAEKNTGNDDIFPNSFRYRWNEDNFGELIVPYEGFSIEMNADNYSLYKNTISLFEHKSIEKNNSQDILIDGQIVDSYTFERNYYFMLNDVRSNYDDSRKWGIIPDYLVKGVVIASY